MPIGSPKFHYFRGDTGVQSLCGRWALFSGDALEGEDQQMGDAPHSDDCKTCWKKRKAEQAVPVTGD